MPETLTRPMARYVHARRVGHLLMLAGQGARDPVSDRYAGVTRDPDGKLASHDIGAQTLAVLTNVERVLRAHALDRRALVDVTVFLTDMAEFEAMNVVWNEFFRETEAPARTTVAVAALPGDNFVEMKAIAAFSQWEPEATK